VAPATEVLLLAGRDLWGDLDLPPFLDRRCELEPRTKAPALQSENDLNYLRAVTSRSTSVITRSRWLISPHSRTELGVRQSLGDLFERRRRIMAAWSTFSTADKQNVAWQREK
jgi:hypothetical protein